MHAWAMAMHKCHTLLRCPWLKRLKVTGCDSTDMVMSCSSKVDAATTAHGRAHKRAHKSLFHSRDTCFKHSGACIVCGSAQLAARGVQSHLFTVQGVRE